MLDIFASLRRDQFGKHGATRRGASGQRLEETKAYVFGEPFDIHLARTVMNAVLRTAAQSSATRPAGFRGAWLGIRVAVLDGAAHRYERVNGAF